MTEMYSCFFPDQRDILLTEYFLKINQPGLSSSSCSSCYLKHTGSKLELKIKIFINFLHQQVYFFYGAYTTIPLKLWNFPETSTQSQLCRNAPICLTTWFQISVFTWTIVTKLGLFVLLSIHLYLSISPVLLLYLQRLGVKPQPMRAQDEARMGFMKIKTKHTQWILMTSFCQSSHVLEKSSCKQGKKSKKTVKDSSVLLSVLQKNLC